MEKERIHKVQLAKILIFNVFKRKDKNKDNDRTPKLFFEKVLLDIQGMWSYFWIMETGFLGIDVNENKMYTYFIDKISSVDQISK